MVMSFFDKLKTGLQTAKNRVTGEYGKVFLTLDTELVRPGDTVTAMIEVKAQDQFSANGILIHLKAEEKREIDETLEDTREIAICRAKETTLELEFEVTEKFELAPGESRIFKKEFEVPKTCEFSFKGRYISHTLTVRAVVDVPWGVALKSEKELPVGGLAVEPHPLKLQHRNLVLDSSLVISDGAPSAAKPCTVNLKMKPLTRFRLAQVEVRLRSVESMRADVIQLKYQHRTDEDEIPREDRMISVVIWESKTSWLAGTEMETADQALTLEMTLPADCKPTYRGREARHQVLIEVELQLDGHENVTFKQELFVHPSQGVGPPQLVWNQL